MYHKPIAGDVFAVYVPEAQIYVAYQFICYQIGKANQITHSHIARFDGWFSTIEEIVPADLKPFLREINLYPDDDTKRIEIESHWGIVPNDHIYLGNLPLICDGTPQSYGGGDMNHFTFVSDDDCILPKDQFYQHFYINNQRIFDMQAFVKDFPKLRSLSIVDAEIDNFSALNELKELRSLTFIRCMVKDDDLADLTVLPHLNIIWISGFPVGVGSQLKKQAHKIAKAKPQQFTYAITGLRKPEWYSANRDNPFADFDEDDNIPKKDVKKCIKIYKDYLKMALGFSTQNLQLDIENLSEQFAKEFNNFGWVDTFYRESICDGFYQIANLVKEKHNCELDFNKIQTKIDKVRDW